MLPKSLKFNNGLEIPIIGLGTFNSPPGQVTEAVKVAIDAGYRHIDCAWYYGNEAEVGEGIAAKIKEGIVKREDLFITSKLWCNYHEKEKVVPMLRDSLKNLKLEYLDLYLIHWPFGFKEEAGPWPTEGGPDAYSDVDITETWTGLEEAQELGLVKSIGVSNFNKTQIEKILNACKIKPVCNQVEVNPNFNNEKLINFCQGKDIVVSGYCPLGRVDSYGKPRIPKPTIFDPKVAEIGKKYDKTPAQVVLNYLIAKLGVVVLPKSVTKSRIIENFNIFDFQLDKEDIDYIDSTHKNVRVCLAPYFGNHKDYPFHDDY
ncbi:aldo-keto reductase family 1 member B1-like [Coccinella septempunctata]|uniref:aldo-keto reductase family 1 member B1-like n=1 Tax=Coccinella septempunctata TaxID=41139 RepID=UPI001D05D6EB|nr:aldo-keto reductase family 1 member B1-like [Coccinella septempunctata]